MNLKNVTLKLVSFYLIFIMVLGFNYSFAEDISSDDETLSIITETLATFSNSNSLNLNSRSCVVIDRLSKSILYGKNEDAKVKMASTTNVMVTQTTLFKCRFFFTNFICNTLFFS